jgi:hypothetical protein
MTADVGYLEAWRLWWAGSLSPDAVLGCFNIRWWGRIGKGMQLFAVLTALADIIGPEVLRRCGQKLRRLVTVSSAKAMVLDAMQHVKHLIRANTIREGTTVLAGHRAGIVTAVIFYSYLGVAVWALLSSPLSWWQRMLLFFVLLAASSVFAPFVAVAVILVLAAAGLLVDLIALRPLASALEHPEFRRGLEGVVLVAFLTGFHFELLAA